MKLLILLLLSIVISVNCLYEDQVGKFDWRARHIGCPNQVKLGRSASGKDFLIVSSKRNALASINVNSGDIDWRQVQEITGSIPPVFNVYNPSRKSVPYVPTLVNGGDYIRVFKRADGVLLWQKRIRQTHKKVNKLIAGKDLLAIVSENGALIYDPYTGEKKIFTSIDATDYVDGYVEDEQMYIVAISGKNVIIHHVDITSDSLPIFGSIQLSAKPKDCVITGNVLVCTDSTGSLTSIVIQKNLVSSTLLTTKDAEINKIDVPRYFTVKTNSNLIVYKIENAKVLEVLKTQASNVFTGVIDVENSDKLLAVYHDLKTELKLYDLSTGKEKLTTKIDKQQAEIDEIHVLSSSKSIQLLTIRKDCRMDLYEINNDSKLSLEWTRFESLANIASVEMIDLPLSESQAMIETEFSDDNNVNVIKSLFKRISTQIEEIKRSTLKFIDRVIKTKDLISKKHVTISIIINHLLGDDSAIRRMKKRRAGSISDLNDIKLERDYFNLRKMIIVSTYSGSLLGLNSEDGSIIWSLYLGNDFAPLSNQFDEKKVPLYIQRGTSYYQFKSQGIVVFNSKEKVSTKMVIFNPINGELIDTIQRNKLKKIELLPYVNENMLHPILTIDINDKIEYYPELNSNYFNNNPIYFFNYDINGQISGNKFDFKTKTIQKTWSSKLNFNKNEKLVSITGKSINQKVHSSGRVLGDRSVLYKYSNPNLIAAQSYDTETRTLGIYLIDTITGQIIHSASYSKVKPPFHLVHCENWIIYTYWNEKTRRTELGVLELFEGKEQTNADHFNSLTTTKNNVEVIAKSYVFSQGISAMSASETEMGLTFRSIIISMPFGGILEVPRRIADARRPLEMTPELREEMIIPYMPEIPIATEELINYNQTVEHIHGIKTTASGLESTSLMLAYGMDMFFTRVTPSGTFDILKDDFDYALISGVMAFLIISSFVVKRIWKQSSVKQAWA